MKVKKNLKFNPIKDKFFRTIGIDESKKEISTTPQHDKSNYRPLIGEIKHQEALKYNHRDDESHHKRRLRRNVIQRVKESKSPIERKHISFNDCVNIIPIPHRSEYSQRIACRMWTRPEEVFENAQRNALEFESEGWDWRSVTEDEGMYINTKTGERIHPVHFEN